jgi:hypothetical protein
MALEEETKHGEPKISRQHREEIFVLNWNLCRTKKEKTLTI